MANKERNKAEIRVPNVIFIAPGTRLLSSLPGDEVQDELPIITVGEVTFQRLNIPVFVRKEGIFVLGRVTKTTTEDDGMQGLQLFHKWAVQRM